MTGANDESPAPAGGDAGRGRKAAWYALAVIASAAGVLLLWAMFWPADECDRPSCARQRYSVALEIDALGQVEPISFEVAETDNPVSLESIMRGGGIELIPGVDQTGLPYDPESGPLDRADLFQFVTAWRSNPTQGVDASLYALFVNSLIADNGEELFGIMFDTAGREGFAVAPRTTERFFREHAPTLIGTLQLRTFVHELLHALNRDHADAAQMLDGRLTLEAPTRCISEQQKRGWRLIEPPLMELSPQTIRFFQTAAPREVLPGPDNSPFAHRRVSPTECEDVREQVPALEDRSRWGVAMRRLKRLMLLPTAAAAEPDANTEQDEEVPFAEIRLQAQPAPYPLGYPVGVRVMVTNRGEEALPIVGRLNPRYGMLTFDYREAGAEEWQTLQPMSFFEPTNDEDALLPPGAQTEQTVPVYYGQDGWTFPAPGDYQLRARLQLGPSEREIMSEPLQISVTAPTTDQDREALQPLLDADGQLANDIGRLLYFGGRIGERDDIAPLEMTAQQFGHTALGAAMRLTLLSHRLRKPIDPATGLRPPPDFEQARQLLEDTCTDSGVAAMTSDVLEQRQRSLPSSLQRRAETDAAAWDGTTSAQTPLATYSDPLLVRQGPSLHFCFNEAGLRAPVRRATSKLAQRLRQARPARIVVVGHSDSVGTCRYNETLALKRAREVRRTLISSGLRRVPIEVVSVGERRPMSFAAASEAQQLNRRVEILMEGEFDQELADEPVIPKCPTHAPKPADLTATNTTPASHRP
ncbi:OmpA family protein [Steroidobacter sp. S1-65]|uniref:OmpA family protein n=1 Tax=Steroidobacter gossypii TaxID=2805490 RepID=A0ABS1WW44_9GAMM|nr:OmpA family protein [Steroidobacter gossypii]MBM0105189.1 OmpA family protein [Steroidobacter gossypii]